MRTPKPRLSSLAVAALVAASACTSALAQPGPRGSGGGPDGSGWGPGMMMGPGMMGERGFGFMCNPRAAGFAEWRMQRIEQAIKPTEAQKAALEQLRQASNKAAEMITASCTGTVPAKAPERMTFAEKRLETMLQAVKTVRPAFETFYAQLDDKQKAQLDQAGPRQWGWRNWRWRWGSER